MRKIRRGRTQHTLNPQQGMSLLEVMIALLILSIGLLGMASLQATSIRNSQSAYMRSQATILAYDAIDRMRGNRVAAMSASAPYSLELATTPSPPAVNCNTNTCSQNQLTGYDLYEWTQTLANELPSGDGSITRITAGGRTIFRVIVVWDDTHGISAPIQMQIEAEL